MDSLIKSEFDYKKNCFDIIRLIAALQVMLGHCFEHFDLIKNSYTLLVRDILNIIPGKGVVIFFVISGFFSLQSIEKSKNFGSYCKKKVLRIYPELWIAFGLNTILIAFFHGLKTGVKDLGIYVITQTTIFQFYTGNWLRNYGVGTPNGSLWTISVIIQFYFVAYFIYKFLRNASIKKWIISIIFSVLISVVLSNLNLLHVPEIVLKLFQVSVIPYLYIFLIGMMIFSYREKIIPVIEKRVFLIYSVYLIVRILMSRLNSQISFGILYDVFSSTILAFAVIGFGYIKSFRTKKEISYSLFIWHMMIVNVIIEISKKVGFNFSVLLGILATVIVVLFSLIIGIISESIKKMKITVKDLETIKHYLTKRIIRFLLYPLCVFPVKKRRIMFLNDLAYNYSCNPKFVCDYLLKNYPAEFDIFFAVKDVPAFKDFNKNITFVKFNSFKYFFYSITSKFFVSNSGGYSYLPIRKSQIVINTFHGGGAYKKLGIYMFNNTKTYKKDLLMQSKVTTVFLSTCKRFTEVISESLLIPKQIFWEIGMPRNDIMRNPDNNLVQHARQKVGLKEDEHLVLYAPTYRKVQDDYFKDSVALSVDIDYQKVCDALSERFGGKWVFGFRLHPCVVNRDAIKGEGLLNLSSYDEVQELLLVADVMINDFSSTMWDFMITGKPSFLYAQDLEDYIRTTDVYTPVDEWPFPKSTNNEQLIQNILSFDQEDYHKKCKHHYDSLGGCESGKATELVCKYIKKNLTESVSFKDIQ